MSGLRPQPPAPAATPGEVERRELTSIRKTIARRLTEAWQIPVFQLQVSVDMTRANELVARLREHEDGPKATRHRRPDEGLRRRRCCATAR